MKHLDTDTSLRLLFWEVLKGVGVDGAGGNLPFFCAFLRFSSLLWRESPLFFCAFLRFFALCPNKGQITAIYWKNGEFHSDPVCTDPVENFPIVWKVRFSWRGKPRHDLVGDFRRNTDELHADYAEKQPTPKGGLPSWPKRLQNISPIPEGTPFSIICGLF